VSSPQSINAVAPDGPRKSNSPSELPSKLNDNANVPVTAALTVVKGAANAEVFCNPNFRGPSILF
jgi:hypothetical protein